MAKKYSFIGLLTFVLVLNFMLVGCDMGITNGGDGLQTEIYTSTAGDTTYQLTLTSAPKSAYALRSAYVFYEGDSFILVIKTGSVTKTSSGTLASGSTENNLILHPKNNPSVTITVMVRDGGMSGIVGAAIEFDDGTSLSLPENGIVLTPSNAIIVDPSSIIPAPQRGVSGLQVEPPHRPFMFWEWSGDERTVLEAYLTGLGLVGGETREEKLSDSHPGYNPAEWLPYSRIEYDPVSHWLAAGFVDGTNDKTYWKFFTGGERQFVVTPPPSSGSSGAVGTDFVLEDVIGVWQGETYTLTFNADETYSVSPALGNGRTTGVFDVQCPWLNLYITEWGKGGGVSSATVSLNSEKTSMTLTFPNHWETKPLDGTYTKLGTSPDAIIVDPSSIIPAPQRGVSGLQVEPPHRPFMFWEWSGDERTVLEAYLTGLGLVGGETREEKLSDSHPGYNPAEWLPYSRIEYDPVSHWLAAGFVDGTNDKTYWKFFTGGERQFVVTPPPSSGSSGAVGTDFVLEDVIGVWQGETYTLTFNADETYSVTPALANGRTTGVFDVQGQWLNLYITEWGKGGGVSSATVSLNSEKTSMTLTFPNHWETKPLDGTYTKQE